MNSYLIDTHILLWWLFEDKQLPGQIKELIEDPENDITVSSVSIWEIVIKKSLKKLKAPDNIHEILLENDIAVLPMTADHALYTEYLPPIHQDPFDRILIAQCIVEKLIFVTNDKIIPQYSVVCFQAQAKKTKKALD